MIDAPFPVLVGFGSGGSFYRGIKTLMIQFMTLGGK